jgi:hypothetical protein
VVDGRDGDDTYVGGGFDDDRLLAHALGLDDDADLEAAGDEGLRRRLAAMRSELAEIGARVDAAVPAPDESYTDLSGGRWAGLHEYLTPGARRRARARPGSWRWLRVVAPAAAIVLALAVGVTWVARQGADVGLRGSGGEVAAPTLSGGAATKAGARLDGFHVVVLARARATAGAFQRFSVVRVLMGQAPATVRLRVVERPAAAGALHLLLLRPVSASGAEASADAQSVADDAAAYGELGTSEPVDFSYRGDPALALELPAGTDPAAVQVP